ncbi:MAG: FKBP-type peptidyl-prolyl cis-trans isomerase [Chitinophagaceae bacterium]
MRKALVWLLIVVIAAPGCLKKETGCPYKEGSTVASAAEQQAIVNYLDSNHITTAVKHSSGMYYQVNSPGSNGSPGLCSQILVNYNGKLVNGTVFDSQTSAVFTLGSLIEGWKTGIPLIQKGGSITLYIPPSLGYGFSDVKDSNNTVVIPANSILIFTITLTDWQ